MALMGGKSVNISSELVISVMWHIYIYIYIYKKRKRNYDEADMGTKLWKLNTVESQYLKLKLFLPRLNPFSFCD
jgi:hypothetical protein